jgi:hypothetical protein
MDNDDTLSGILARLDGPTLRQLAVIADAHRPTIRIADPEAAAAELVAITARGSIPTIGWWRRHRHPKPMIPAGDSAGIISGPRPGSGGGSPHPRTTAAAPLDSSSGVARRRDRSV